VELVIVLFTLIEIGAALAIYKHAAIRKQIHARVRKALQTACKMGRV
jgi:hypothetical protein